MSAGNAYREKAAEIGARAKRERDPVVRSQFESLKRSYHRLAVQADKNTETDIVYETPRPRLTVQQLHQQQQQRQSKKDKEPGRQKR